MSSPENNLITTFTHKEIASLYKTFLESIEDLRTDHQIMLQKVAEKNGEQFASDIDYFTTPKYEQLRKRVLDQGNECSRKMIGFLDYFNFTIDTAKVEQAAAQKRTITKKVVVSSPTYVE